LKRRLESQSNKIGLPKEVPGGVRGMISHVYQQEGIRGFYRGYFGFFVIQAYLMRYYTFQLLTQPMIV
jgi:hypothetical protein